jgi:glycosyltransferase involved in cell wall biosynthesis
MISVIVVTYNQEETIARALDSILMQKCSHPYEIVIGEDCSTDSTADVCREYARRHADRIRLFCNEHNKGLIDNYYDCLLQCRGKYIADCAGDDFWTDELKLQKEADLLEADPTVSLVHTAWMRYDETTGKATPADSPFTAPITAGKDLLPSIITQTSQTVIHLCSALYRRDIIMQAYQADTFLFRNKAFGCEDMQVCAVMAHEGNIAFLAEPTLCYSVGHESVSIPHAPEALFRFVEGVASLSFYLARKYHVDHALVGRHFSFRLYELSMHAFRAHSVELRKKVWEYKKAWGAKAGWRTRLINIITSNEGSWQLALRLRSLLKHR